MPTASRETILGAIFAKIQGMSFSSPINGSSTWVTASRRLRLWGDVPSDQQPAAFLVEHREVDEWTHLGTVRRKLDGLALWAYARTDDPMAIGGTYINMMLESLETAFAPDAMNGQCTLGGLVYWIRQEGRIFKDPGDIDNQAMLICPLVVEVP